MDINLFESLLTLRMESKSGTHVLRCSDMTP